MNRVKKRPSVAALLGFAALFVALSGIAIADHTAAGGGGKVGTHKIKNDSIRSQDVRDRALQLSDFSPAAREGLKGEKGDQGSQGEPGAEGPQGPPGEDGEDGTVPQTFTFHVPSVGTFICDRLAESPVTAPEYDCVLE